MSFCSLRFRWISPLSFQLFHVLFYHRRVRFAMLHHRVGLSEFTAIFHHKDDDDDEGGDWKVKRHQTSDKFDLKMLLMSHINLKFSKLINVDDCIKFSHSGVHNCWIGGQSDSLMINMPKILISFPFWIYISFNSELIHGYESCNNNKKTTKMNETRDSSNWKLTKPTTSLHFIFLSRFAFSFYYILFTFHISSFVLFPLLWLGEGGSWMKMRRKYHWMGEEKRKCHLWGGGRQLAERQWWRSTRKRENVYSMQEKNLWEERKIVRFEVSSFAIITNFKISWYVV